jgi:hypothetical protein
VRYETEPGWCDFHESDSYIFVGQLFFPVYVKHSNRTLPKLRYDSYRVQDYKYVMGTSDDKASRFGSQKQNRVFRSAAFLLGTF